MPAPFSLRHSRPIAPTTPRTASTTISGSSDGISCELPFAITSFAPGVPSTHCRCSASFRRCPSRRSSRIAGSRSSANCATPSSGCADNSTIGTVGSGRAAIASRNDSVTAANSPRAPADAFAGGDIAGASSTFAHHARRIRSARVWGRVATYISISFAADANIQFSDSSSAGAFARCASTRTHSSGQCAANHPFNSSIDSYDSARVGSTSTIPPTSPGYIPANTRT